MIVWTDIESTGLDERAGKLLEVALVVTDDELNETAAKSSVICTREGVADPVALMNDYVREMHTKNGLLEAIKNGPFLETAEEEMLAFIAAAFKDVPMVPGGKCAFCGKHRAEHQVRQITVPGRDALVQALAPTCTDEATSTWFCELAVPALTQTPLAGSTIAFDRRWLRQHMPRLEALFLHRSIDVSSITELAKRWAPEIYKNRPKSAVAHRALADVRESIAYLKYFREKGFVGVLGAQP